MLNTGMLEVRFVEVRAIKGRIIFGTAVVFNKPSNDLGGFREIISNSSITQELLNRSDIQMLYNHKDTNGILARYTNGSGTLKLTLTAKGIDFEFEAADSPLGNEVLSSVQRGDLRGASFAFKVAVGGETWSIGPTGRIRTITNISYLQDMSIVTKPAYKDTIVDTRAMPTDTNPINTDEMDIMELNAKVDNLTAICDKMCAMMETMMVEDKKKDAGTEVTTTVIESTTVITETETTIPVVDPPASDAPAETRSLVGAEFDTYYADMATKFTNVKI